MANKVVLDSYCSASGTSLSKQHDHFIDILSGKNAKTFKDQNRFLTLVSYIWFNVAIMSLTDCNIVSAIDMTQRHIYNDYLAIMSLISMYGQNMTRFSIGKPIEAYGKKNKTADFCTGTRSLRTKNSTLC